MSIFGIIKKWCICHITYFSHEHKSTKRIEIITLSSIWYFGLNSRLRTPKFYIQSLHAHLNTLTHTPTWLFMRSICYYAFRVILSGDIGEIALRGIGMVNFRANIYWVIESENIREKKEISWTNYCQTRVEK